MSVRINELGNTTKPGEEAAVTGGVYPSGSSALYRMQGGKRMALDPNEPVTLINVSLSEYNLRTVNDAIKNPKGNEEKTVAILPFGIVVLPSHYARRVLSTQEKPGGDPKMVVAPQDGDCGGKHAFTGYGKKFKTCPFANCGHHGPLPAGVKWSIFQVQHRVSMLGTEPAIRRVIETIDNRNEVVMWGLEVILQRTRARQERLGLVGVTNPLNVTY